MRCRLEEIWSHPAEAEHDQLSCRHLSCPVQSLGCHMPPGQASHSAPGAQLCAICSVANGTAARWQAFKTCLCCVGVCCGATVLETCVHTPESCDLLILDRLSTGQRGTHALSPAKAWLTDSLRRQGFSMLRSWSGRAYASMNPRSTPACPAPTGGCRLHCSLTCVSSSSTCPAARPTLCLPPASTPAVSRLAG